MKINVRAIFAVMLAAALLAACGGDKPEALLASAKASLAKNDDKAAVIQIKNALQANPNFAEARYLLGATLLDRGDADAAELELRKAQALNFSPDLVVPKLAAALLALGQYKKLTDEFSTAKLSAAAATADIQTSLAYALAMQGHAEASEAALKAALAADPGFVPASIAQARFEAGKGNLDGALALLDSILKRNPRSAEAWKLKGDLLLYLKAQPTQALSDYRSALAVKSNFAAAHLAILGILVQQRNVDEAKKQLEQLRKITGSSFQTEYVEALIAYLKNDLKRARELAQQLLKLAPDSPPILLLAGTVELQTGSLLQAQTYFEHAVQLAPQAVVARRMLVTTYLRSNQPDRALAALHPGQSKDQVPSALYSVAGEVYLQNGDVNTAEEFFAKAAKINPADAGNRTSLALTHLMSGAAPLAFDELQNIAASDKGTSADLALVSVHIKRGEFDKALVAIDALERKQPDQPLAANLRGRVKLAMKNTAGARESFEHALVIAPTYYPAVASLAALDVADNRPEEARKRLREFSAKDPKNSQALMALSELAMMFGPGKEEAVALLGRAIAANPSESAPRLFLINLYLGSKGLTLATAAAQDAVAALPERPEVLDALGRVQQESGEFNQAIATYNKLVAMLPNSPAPYMRLADVQMAANNREAAQKSLRKGLEIKPDLIEAQRKLVSLDAASGNLQDSLEIARTVQRQRPKEAVGFSLEGDISAARRDWDKAAGAYRTGLKQVSSSELAVKLHTVLGASGKDAEAEKFETAWRREHPDDAAFLFHLADLALVRKDYASAGGLYLEVVKRQPKNAAAFNNLAWVSSQQNKEGALAYAEKANQLAPNQPPFMDTLATVLAEAKQYDRAIALQKKAVELLPSNAELKFNLAKLYLKAGDKAGARTELNQLAALGSKFSAQAEVANLLKDL